MRSEAIRSTLSLPHPSSVRTFYPHVEIPGSFQEALKPFGNARIFLYGSSATGEKPSAFDPAKRGEVDLLIISSDSRELYKRMQNPNLSRSHFKLGWPRNPGYRAALTFAGLSYHRGFLVIDGERRPAKIGVAKVIPAINHLRGGRSLGETELRTSKPWLHLIADRFEKPRVIPIQSSEDLTLDRQFDMAVNEARFRAAYFTLGKLHNPFSQAEFVFKYARKSYDSADIRQLFGLESGGKADLLVFQNPEAFYAMLNPILESFCQYSLITRLGEPVFQINVRPTPEEIANWEISAKITALVAAVKYWLADRGLVDGAKYFFEKQARKEANGLQRQ